MKGGEQMSDKQKTAGGFSSFLKIVKGRMADAEIGSSSVVVAYYLLFSLFPLLIAVGNLIPYLQIEADTVLSYLTEIIPSEIFSFLGPAIKSLLTQRSGGLLSVSALVTLWSASQSINALQKAMNRAYGVEGRGNFVITRLISIVALIFFMLAFVFVTIVFGLGKMIIDFIHPIFDFPMDWIDKFQALKWPVTLIGLLLLMSLIYLIIPNAKVRFRSVFPGAVFATVGWMILSQGFGLYAKYFASRVSGYQIIGSFIVLMIWLNLVSMIVILGGIMNAVVAEYTTGHEIEERSNLIDRISNKRP